MTQDLVDPATGLPAPTDADPAAKPVVRRTRKSPTSAAAKADSATQGEASAGGGASDSSVKPVVRRTRKSPTSAAVKADSATQGEASAVKPVVRRTRKSPTSAPARKSRVKRAPTAPAPVEVITPLAVADRPLFSRTTRRTPVPAPTPDWSVFSTRPAEALVPEIPEPVVPAETAVPEIPETVPSELPEAPEETPEPEAEPPEEPEPRARFHPLPWFFVLAGVAAIAATVWVVVVYLFGNGVIVLPSQRGLPDLRTQPRWSEPIDLLTDATYLADQSDLQVRLYESGRDNLMLATVADSDTHVAIQAINTRSADIAYTVNFDNAKYFRLASARGVPEYVVYFCRGLSYSPSYDTCELSVLDSATGKVKQRAPAPAGVNLLWLVGGDSVLVGGAFPGMVYNLMDITTPMWTTTELRLVGDKWMSTDDGVRNITDGSPAAFGSDAVVSDSSTVVYLGDADHVLRQELSPSCTLQAWDVGQDVSRWIAPLSLSPALAAAGPSPSCSTSVGIDYAADMVFVMPLDRSGTAADPGVDQLWAYSYQTGELLWQASVPRVRNDSGYTGIVGVTSRHVVAGWGDRTVLVDLHTRDVQVIENASQAMMSERLLYFSRSTQTQNVLVACDATIHECPELWQLDSGSDDLVSIAGTIVGFGHPASDNAAPTLRVLRR